MAAVFRHSLARLRMQIVGWGLTFAFLGWITTWAYDSIMSTQSQWQQMLDSFPPSVMAFFGEMTKAFEADGYLDVGLFSYAVVILAFFGIILGSGLMASDEEAGRLDLIQAHPVSRGKQFWGRLLASTAATIAILFMTWTGLAVGLYGSGLPAGVADLAVVCLPVLAEVMLFATLALLLSMLMPSRSMAASVASIVLVASYAVTSLARVFSGLKGAARLSPLTYFQSGYAINGLNLAWLAGLMAAATLFSLAAWWLYRRRDLRVSGEGNWRLPGFSFKRRAG